MKTTPPFAVLLIALPLAALALPAREEPAPAATGPRALEGRRLVVGGDSSFPPWSFLDQADRPAGHDVEIMNALAARLGFAADYRLTPWSEALAGLRAGRLDLLMNTVYSDERRAYIDFTIPMWIESYSVFARRGAPFRETNDLGRGRLVGLRDDASIERLLEPMGLAGAIRLVERLPEGLRLLEQGGGDFLLAPYSTGMELIERNGLKNVAVVGSAVLPSLNCLALKKGQPELLAALNVEIDRLKNDGSFKRLRDKWKLRLREDETPEAAVLRLAWLIALLAGAAALLLAWSWLLKRQVRRATARLSASERDYRTLVANVPGIVYRAADRDRRVLKYASPEIERLTGRPASDFSGAEGPGLAGLIHPDDRPAAAEAVSAALAERRPYAADYRMTHADGGARWMHEQGQGVFDERGGLQHLDGVIIDINERKRLEEELRVFATIDAGTGVYNRRYGLALLDKQISQSRRSGEGFCLCYVDIDGLKAVNDRIGHQAGDELISSIVRILAATARASDSLCRLGGDEFMLIMPKTDPASAELYWKRVLASLAEENLRSARSYPLGASHGVAAFDPAESQAELLSRADAAMYKEKQANKRARGA